MGVGWTRRIIDGDRKDERCERSDCGKVRRRRRLQRGGGDPLRFGNCKFDHLYHIGVVSHPELFTSGEMLAAPTVHLGPARMDRCMPSTTCHDSVPGVPAHQSVTNGRDRGIRNTECERGGSSAQVAGHGQLWRYRPTKQVCRKPVLLPSRRSSRQHDRPASHLLLTSERAVHCAVVCPFTFLPHLSSSSSVPGCSRAGSTVAAHRHANSRAQAPW